MFSLGVNPENVNPMGNLTDQAMGLVLHMQSRGRMAELVTELKKHRPHINWDAV